MAHKKLASHYSFFYKSTFIITLVPKAPNREPVPLIVDASVCIPNAAAQAAVPSIVGIGLRRTPPDTVAANAAVIPIAEAVPARKTSE